MKHRLLLFLALLLATATLSHAYDFEVDGIYYNIDGENVSVTYYRYFNQSYSGDIIIPESVSYKDTTYSVTSIGDSAFRDCSSLTSVTIPDSVTSIGSYAFYNCTGLTTVTIPDSVTSIGNSAFSGCSGLTSVSIPNSVTSIGSYAFYNCTGLASVNIFDIESWCKILFNDYNSNPLYNAHNLYLNGVIVTNLIIPNSVTKIGNYAFCGCSGLTSVTIPDFVAEIGSYAFSRCSGLTSVTIPNSVAEIGSYAFSNCSGLTSVTIPDSVAEIGSYAFSWCSGLKSLVIACPTIGMSAFENCSNLTSLTLQSGVNCISQYAFRYCTSLTKVVIPSTVQSISYNCFEGCKSLEEVSMPQGVTSFSYCFQGCTALNKFSGSAATADGCAILFSNGLLAAFTNNCGKTTFSIPEGTKTLGSSLFEGNSDLTEVYVPSSVTKINGNVFKNCAALKKVTFASGSESLNLDSSGTFCTCPIECVILGRNLIMPSFYDKKCPFENVLTLKQFTICEGVTALPTDLLYRCNKLPELVVPASVTSFGSYTISETYNLTMLHHTPPALTSVYILKHFNYYNENIKILVPKQSLEAYKNAQYWSELSDNIFPIAEEGDIGYRFAYNGLRFEITDAQNRLCKLVNGGIEYPYVGELTVPTRVYLNGEEYTPSDIDKYAFENNTAITSLVLSAEITGFGADVVSCTSLENILVSDEHPNLKSIDGVLYDKDVTRLVVLPPALRGNYTTPASLREFTLKYNTVLPNLESLTINDGIEGEAYIDNAANLKHMVIGNGIKRFKTYMCPALEYLEIGSGIDDINGYTFYDTANIKTLIIRDSEKPLRIEPKSVDDGYIPAFRSITPQYFYIGRDFQAVRPPNYPYFYHYTTLPMIEFGPMVKTVDEYLIKAIRQGAKIVSQSYQQWATVPKEASYYNLLPYNLFAKENDEIIPDELVLENIPVIASRAFYNVENMPEKVTIGEGVEEIGNYAFGGCSSLTAVTIPDSVTSIGESAFYYCRKLAEVTVLMQDPSKVSFGPNCFGYNINTLKVPVGTLSAYEQSSIAKYFNKIEELRVPCDSFSFENESYDVYVGEPISLTVETNPVGSVIVDPAWTSSDESIATVDSDGIVAAHKAGTATITITSGELSASCQVVCLPAIPIVADGYFTATNVDNVDIRYHITSGNAVEVVALENSEKYTGAVNIPASVKAKEGVVQNPVISWNGTWNSSSQSSAYDGLQYTCNSPGSNGSTTTRCTFSNVKSITFTVVSNGENNYDYLTVGNLDSSCSRTAYKNKFSSYGSVQTVTYTIPDADEHYVEFCYSKDGSVDNAPDNATVYVSAIEGFGNTYAVVREFDVTAIGDSAFSDCSEMTDVDIPDSVTSIGEGTFAACTKLSSFNGKYASDDNRCLIVDGVLNGFAPAGLSSYDIPDSVTTIGSHVFKDCTELHSVSIPNTVTAIGTRAFYGCSSLQEIKVEKPQPDMAMGNNVFENVPTSTCVLLVPKGSKALYAEAEKWKEFANIKEFGGEEEAFAGDANGDEVVNVTDVVWIVNYVLGKGNEEFKFDNADTNADGIINVTDVVNTVNIVLASPAAKCPITPMAVADGALKVEAASLGGGETVSAVANVEAPFAATAVQFELTLPEGVTLAGVSAGGSHSALFRGAEGVCRVVCYSSANETLAPDALTLTFVTDSRYRGGDIALANALAVEADGTEHRLASGAIETSLDATSLTPDALYTVYTLQGTLVGTSLTAAEVRALTPGLYIANGRKMVIR